jgi:hypothetical protein
MDNMAGLDFVLGGLAIAIFAGGLLLLLSGVTSMNRK